MREGAGMCAAIAMAVAAVSPAATFNLETPVITLFPWMPGSHRLSRLAALLKERPVRSEKGMVRRDDL
jgi:enoyl-CoA hydratase/carnithine racemase